MASTQYPTYEDPRDEGPLADLVSAGMWTTAGLVGAAMFALPGSTHEHLLAGLAVAGAAVLWGVISLVLYLKRATMSLAQPRGRHRHHGTAGRRGDLGLRRRHQLPRAAAAVHLALHRLLLPAAHGLAAGGAVRRRLRHAAALRPDRDRDRLPRAGAGLRGRHRGRVVRDADPQAPPAARRGAPARDGRARPADRRSTTAAASTPRSSTRSDGPTASRWCCSTSTPSRRSTTSTATRSATRCCAPSPSACADVVREGDSLARLGGDEFAVIAPGARSSGVARIVASLEDAIAGADFPPASPPCARASRGRSRPPTRRRGQELLDRADQRLLYRKRLNKQAI